MKRLILIAILSAFLLLGSITAVSATVVLGIESPADNRTYTYTSHHELDVSLFGASACTDCNYFLYWHGDASGHGDETYPAHTYPVIPVSCSEILSGSEYFNVDFDGKYTMNVTGICDATPVSAEVDFYVDRDELEQSRPITAILSILGILGIAFLLGYIAKNLSDKHAPLKLYLLFVQLFIGVITMFGFYSVGVEYLKYPHMSSAVNMALYVFLWGVIVVTVFYFIIYLMKTLLESMRYKQAENGKFLREEDEE